MHPNNTVNIIIPRADARRAANTVLREHHRREPAHSRRLAATIERGAE